MRVHRLRVHGQPAAGRVELDQVAGAGRGAQPVARSPWHSRDTRDCGALAAPVGGCSP
ncbi:hypothetical protein [Goodfellowiella coeruleoviolacea]|uniref:hypothetical protein n=1 Tax=Goodfellowiella coeruleoviolacea TaxID=334858 RepID=UPI0020A478B5|nr:hypothetical protein [Goodfellowiella coeruleoviolacea]